MTPRTLFDKIWDAHVVAERARRAVAALRRPPPRPRGHLAAGVRRPSPRGPRGAPPRPGCGHDGPQRPHRRRRGEWRRRHERRADGGAAQELRRVRHLVLRCRASLAGHRPRDRSGARAHAPGHGDRLRRLAHRDARCLRGVRARHRYLRGRARAGDPVSASVATRRPWRCVSRARCPSESPRRTPRSACSTPSAPRVPPATSSSTPGSVVRGFSMEQRMTLCNLTIEGGGRAGMIAPDDTTFAYIKRRPLCAARARSGTQAVAAGASCAATTGATYDRVVVHRRGHARADGDLGHDARAIGAGHRTRP